MGNQMPNGEARSNVSYYPGYQSTPIVSEEKKPRWWLRATHWIGITMATTENPRGWSWNPATATLMILVVSLVAGGAYYLGGRDKQVDALERRLEGVSSTANTAIDRATYAAGLKDKQENHGNTNTNTGGH